MKKLIYFLVSIVLISCSTENKKLSQLAQKVIITGKVLDSDLEGNEIEFAINRLGLPQTKMNSKLDSLGYFSLSFESYIPTDVWVQYKTNFLVLTYPGDSIYIEFNGKSNQRQVILKTIKFSGSSAKINREAAIFQQMYFSNPLYSDWNAKENANKKYAIKEYMNYLDTVKQKCRELYDKFVSDVSPGKESKLWALTYIDQHYYDALSFYPMKHQMANQLKNTEWKVPLNYYNPLLNRLPLTEDMFISGDAINHFINGFHIYINGHLSEEKAIQKYKEEQGYGKVPPDLVDSLIVCDAIKYTPDDLLRQMVLTEIFAQYLGGNKIQFFEKYRNVLDKYIKEPFLKEPLLKQYSQVKEWSVNPQIASDAFLKNVVNSSVKPIMDSIFYSNKGKVIYIDYWATWCHPCLEEMPNSKDLMMQMKDKDVAFVFICLDSENKVWKSKLSDLQLGGQQYFLTPQQSNDIRKAFGIDGIPHYFLIDKKGSIVEKGSHLRPNLVKEKIEKLLKN